MAKMELGISDVVAGALEQIRNDGYTVQRWIPCSEMLPEEEGQYIVTTTSGKVYIWSFYFSLASKRPYFSGDEKVVAWMPRPEPPGKETADDT